MKKTTAIFLGLMFGVSAVSLSASAACPYLAGQYLCKDDRDAHDMVVDQKVVNNQVVYLFTSPGQKIEVITDGTTHPFPSGNGLKDGNYTAVCRDNHVLGDVKALLVDNRGQAIGTVQLNMTFSRDDVRELISHTVGNAVVQGKNYAIDSTETCTQK